MPGTVEVYYALQSPWTYLAWPRLRALAAERHLKVTYRPVKAGAVFAASGGLPLAKRPPQRQAYRMMELKRWRDIIGLPLTLQPAFFPVEESLAAKMVIAHGQAGGDIGVLSFAVMRAVWAEERNIHDRPSLIEIAEAHQLDGKALLTKADAETSASTYDEHTQAAIDTGVFGLPTFVTAGELFWGQDRLDLLARALA